MTKSQIITAIQTAESTAWLNMVEHTYTHRPSTDTMAWDETDTTHRELLNTWHALHALLWKLDLPVSSDDENYKKAMVYDSLTYERDSTA